MSARLSALRVGVSAALLVMALQVGAARGDPAPMPRVTGAPIPGDESGLTWNPDAAPQASTAREIARGVLWVPNAIIWVVLLPVRGVIWVYDRYDLENRYYATFYNPSRTFGIHPEVQYATGFGLMFGGRLDSTNTFGDHERLTLAG